MVKNKTRSICVIHVKAAIPSVIVSDAFDEAQDTFKQEPLPLTINCQWKAKVGETIFVCAELCLLLCVLF